MWSAFIFVGVQLCTLSPPTPPPLSTPPFRTGHPRPHEAGGEHGSVGGGCAEQRAVAAVRDDGSHGHAGRVVGQVERGDHRSDLRGDLFLVCCEFSPETV